MYSCHEGGVYGQITSCALLFCKHASFICNVGNHWALTQFWTLPQVAI